MEVEKRPVNGFGIASLVFGIVGILTICGCGIGFFFGLFGVIFGILGLTVLKRSGKGLAIAGLIVSGVALLCGTFWMVLYLPRHKSNNTSNNYVATSTQNTSTAPSSSSENSKPETSSYSTSSADLEKDKEELKESWDSVKDEFKDILSDAYEEAKQEAKENSSETNNSSDSSNSSTNSSSNKVTPELKEFCDSYEAFIDQYIELMKSADASTPEFMNEYADLLDSMADFEEKSNYYYSIEDTMSEADYAYFTASMLRIDAKLMRYSATEF